MNSIISKRTKIIFALIILMIVVIITISNTTSILRIVYPIKYKELVLRYSSENNVDPYLVFAIIKAESGFRPNAISHKNARGLMQISEGTGKWGAEKLGIQEFTVENLYDPETNIRIGCWYVRRLMTEFNMNMDLVIAAYNGGSGNVSQWLRDENLSSSGKELEKIPFKETEMFLKKVKNYHSTYKKLYNSLKY